MIIKLWHLSGLYVFYMGLEESSLKNEIKLFRYCACNADGCEVHEGLQQFASTTVGLSCQKISLPQEHDAATRFDSSRVQSLHARFAGNVFRAPWTTLLFWRSQYSSVWRVNESYYIAL